MTKPKFELGRTAATDGALAVAERFGVNLLHLLERHADGDWGTLPTEDKALNEQALHDGGRLMSQFGDGRTRLWIITEADRSATTVLCPEEY